MSKGYEPYYEMNYIESDRLYITEFEEGDWTAVLAYQQNPLYLRFYPWEQRTEHKVREFVDRFISQQTERMRMSFQLAIRLKETEQLIGSCGLRLLNAGMDEASIGFEIDPAYWGNGYATEAAKEMLWLGFGDYGVDRIFASCISENAALRRVLRKIGMREVAVTPSAEHFKGHSWDIAEIEMVHEDWGPGKWRFEEFPRKPENKRKKGK